jgi:predicted outer membrane repeat protein
MIKLYIYIYIYFYYNYNFDVDFNCIEKGERILFKNCKFENESAVNKGGAIYIGKKEKLFILFFFFCLVNK